MAFPSWGLFYDYARMPLRCRAAARAPRHAAAPLLMPLPMPAIDAFAAAAADDADDYADVTMLLDAL